MPTLREKIVRQLERGRFTDNDGKVAMKLAAKFDTNPASVSAMLSKMASEGQIERQADNRGTYAIWLPATNGQADIIDGIINAVGKLKAENQRQAEVIAGLCKERDKARADAEQKQLEIAALRRQLDEATQAAAAKNKASDQLTKLREMLDL